MKTGRLVKQKMKRRERESEQVRRCQKKNLKGLRNLRLYYKMFWAKKCAAGESLSVSILTPLEIKRVFKIL